jgi:hypothetical protein
MSLNGLLSDEMTDDPYMAMEEFHRATVCADVAEMIDKHGLAPVLEDIIFYVNNPAALHALSVFETKLKERDSGFYKTTYRV